MRREKWLAFSLVLGTILLAFGSNALGVQPDVIIELPEILGPLAKARARLVVGVVTVGHEGVEPVVATRQLQHDEDRTVLAGVGLHRRVHCVPVQLGKGALEEHRHRPHRGGPEGGSAKKLAAGLEKIGHGNWGLGIRNGE